MKSVLILLFLSPFAWAEPLLVISIMVKDEAHVMRPTLEPFLQAGIKDYVVYDTGSTDNTIEVTRALFQEYELSETQTYIVQEPFVDFSTSRNRALDLVDEKFPQAVFTLMVDAEWCLQEVPELIDFCERHRHSIEPMYFLDITCHQDGHHAISYTVSRLIRAQAHARFVGLVHEELQANEHMHIKLPCSIFFEWKRSDQGGEKSNERWYRDKEILRDSLKKNPDDPRAIYYLAQTCRDLGDLYDAYIHYTARTTFNTGNPEEIFLSHYYLGVIAEQLSHTDTQFTWSHALGHYLDAFSMCPLRIEPLIALAFHYYEEGNIRASYIFARYAAELPDSHHYIEKYLYNVVRYDLLGVCAIAMEEYDLAQWAITRALTSDPQNERLKQNLVICQKLQNV